MRALQIAVLAILTGRLFPLSAQQSSQRSYKASANVTVLGIPVFSRSGVGYGWATQREDPSTEKVELEFLGASIPERAHGLNRFGYIQESVEEKNHAPVRAIYFGVMTASREESIADAKAALAAQHKDGVAYVAATARLEDRRASYSVRHLVLPETRPSQTEDLTRIMKTSFASAPLVPADVDKTVSTPAPQTFLYALRRAMLSGETNSRFDFLYNGKPLVLTTSIHRDEKVQMEMRRENLAASNMPILRLTGVIENQIGHERTQFIVWYQKAANILPLRFEFRPKSYLKLVFEAQPYTPAGPEVASVANSSNDRP